MSQGTHPTDAVLHKGLATWDPCPSAAQPCTWHSPPSGDTGPWGSPMTPRPLEDSISRLLTRASQDCQAAQGCRDLAGPSRRCQGAGLHPEARGVSFPREGEGGISPTPPPPPGPRGMVTTCSGSPLLQPHIKYSNQGGQRDPRIRRVSQNRSRLREQRCVGAGGLEVLGEGAWRTVGVQSLAR